METPGSSEIFSKSIGFVRVIEGEKKLDIMLTERRTHENEIFKIRIWTGEGIGDRSGMMVGCI